ncbi:MAG TPA: MEDS domain-containing protein [Vicinamibacterales bacterium]|nr:MEDS domain-containing protein [Vicinamibacterales bacterium]
MRSQPVVHVSEHHLQLFDSSKSLADSVSAFLIAGFKRDEPLLIVATPEHRELLGKRLEQAGINLREAALANRVTILDAAQTLDKFMRQDTPNPAAFDEVVGTLVARLSNGKRVCIYGEMVDVLAAQGKYKAAHLLEVLWNRLGRREHFTLFCGYASGHFGDPKTAKALADICASHGHVHRKREDLLAEYLLDQHDPAADTAAGSGSASVS